MIKILIVDDHEIIRKGLRQILADTSDMQVVDEAGNGQEALNKICKNDYDMVLLDISMPGRCGMDLLKDIKSQKPKLSVLMLTMHPEEEYAVRALRAGASGYLTKESASEELISAIRIISRGGKHISMSLAEKIACHMKADDDMPPHESLSDREYEVLCLIASGKPVKNISEELTLSPKTISTYRSRILQKMNLSNNAEITHYAFKNQLVH
jgi:DNA-binding NarL/FixJ family response regulator